MEIPLKSLLETEQSYMQDILNMEDDLVHEQRKIEIKNVALSIKKEELIKVRNQIRQYLIHRLG